MNKLLVGTTVKYYLCFMLLANAFAGRAQMSLEGELLSYINNIISDLPGPSENTYTDPDSEMNAQWLAMMDSLMHRQFDAADAIALELEYRVVGFTDTTTNKEYWILQPGDEGANHWGYYFFNLDPCRSNVIIQSTHPRKDLNTGKQGAYVFQYADAFAFMLAGTNRCNHDDPSPCSGSTSVCSENSQAYRISDLSHNGVSIFQQTTDFLANTIENSYFIQLHGFTKLATDPYVIMSNSSMDDPTSLDYLVRLRSFLFAEDTTLTFKIAHIDDWTRLAGQTNVQGRLINGSENPCNTSSPQNSGRFLHLEQERYKLRQDLDGWHKMAVALSHTFNALHVDSPLSTDKIYAARDTIFINSSQQLLDSLSLRCNHLHLDHFTELLGASLIIRPASGCN